MINNLKNFVSRYFRIFVSNNVVRNITKLMHINKIGKKIYFKLFSPKDKKISHTIEGITAQFYVKNYTDLIYLTETAIGVGDERHVIKLLLDNLKQGEVVFDIGAFLGLHAIFFGKKICGNGQVIAFEPAFTSYQALEDNIALNNLNNIIPIDIALGNEVKDAILKGNDSSMYSLNEKFGSPSFNQKTTIMPGDLVIQTRKLPTPNIIKIDVEGYEFAVIKGLEKALKNSKCRLVCCEVHPTLLPDNMSSEMVIDTLKSYGFYRIDTFGRGLTFHIFCYKE